MGREVTQGSNERQSRLARGVQGRNAAPQPSVAVLAVFCVSPMLASRLHVAMRHVAMRLPRYFLRRGSAAASLASSSEFSSFSLIDAEMGYERSTLYSLIAADRPDRNECASRPPYGEESKQIPFRCVHCCRMFVLIASRVRLRLANADPFTRRDAFAVSCPGVRLLC